MDNTATTISFAEILKTQTAAAHTALESLPLSESLMSPDLTTDSYATYLCLMHDIVLDAEQNIFPVLKGVVPDLNERAKIKHIEADLDSLGKSYSSNKHPISEGLETITEGFAMGVFYVMEGSTLGGRVILKNVLKQLGLDENTGTSYFAGYKEKTGAMWKGFLETLLTYEAQNDNKEEIIKGANHAFKSIYTHFSQKL